MLMMLALSVFSGATRGQLMLIDARPARGPRGQLMLMMLALSGFSGATRGQLMLIDARPARGQGAN